MSYYLLYDPVVLRDVRDKITEETQNMTLEQLKEYIADRLKNSHLKTVGR